MNVTPQTTAARSLFTRAAEELRSGIGAFDDGKSKVAQFGNGPVTWGRSFLDTRAKFAQSAAFLRNGATLAGEGLDPELAARLNAHAQAIEGALELMNHDKWPDRLIFHTALEDAVKALDDLPATTEERTAFEQWKIANDSPASEEAVIVNAPVEEEARELGA